MQRQRFPSSNETPFSFYKDNRFCILEPWRRWKWTLKKISADRNRISCFSQSWHSNVGWPKLKSTSTSKYELKDLAPWQHTSATNNSRESTSQCRCYHLNIVLHLNDHVLPSNIFMYSMYSIGWVPLIKLTRCGQIEWNKTESTRSAQLPGLREDPIGWHKSPAGEVADDLWKSEKPIG